MLSGKFTRDQLVERLKHMGACQPAVDWVRSQTGTPEELYNRCSAQWLSWLVGRALSPPARVALAVQLATPALRFLNAADYDARSALDIASHWAGELSFAAAIYEIGYNLIDRGLYDAPSFARAAIRSVCACHAITMLHTVVSCAALAAQCGDGRAAHDLSLTESARLIRLSVSWPVVEQWLRGMA